MLPKAISVLILMTSLLVGTSFADTLVVNGIKDADDASAQYPKRGSAKASVASGWGEPAVKSGPVGDPPISRWEYEPFVVYFENDRVLHTVAKR